MPRTLLIPALLDDWFPLLRYAFASREWEPVLLREERGLADRGMRYFHNELCYPVFLVAGQVLAALESGEYNPAECGVPVSYTHLTLPTYSLCRSRWSPYH